MSIHYIVPIDFSESRNYISNVRKPNECFLIPSQVTLNESNIINWNCNKVG